MNKILLTVEEAARALAISRSKLYQMFQDKDVGIRVIRIGRCVRIPMIELERWVQSEIDGQAVCPTKKMGPSKDKGSQFR